MPTYAATPAQLQFAADCFAQVAALSTIPERHQEQLRAIGSPARAVWVLASFLEKPSRIPADFGSLLDMDPGFALAAAAVAKYEAELRVVLPDRVTGRLLKFGLPD